MDVKLMPFESEKI